MPRIAPRALHISTFSWGGPPNLPQGKAATHKFSHHKISNPPPHLQILYTPMLCNCITVYRYESNKSMLICVIIIIKDHKMKQIINYLPKINPELYLNYSIIKKILFNVSPSDVTFCQMIPINDNWVLYNHDHKISLHRSNHHLKHHYIVIGQTSYDVKYLLS